MRPFAGRLALVGATLLAALVFAPRALAEIVFGEHDVQTIFYIAKSNDRNRVDYAVRLDASCRPVGPEPLYCYWRTFEPNVPPIVELNFLDESVYGIDIQEVGRTDERGGTHLTMAVAAIEEDIEVYVWPGAEGCRAHAKATIGGQPAVLDHIFVQLRGLAGVDHIMVRGNAVRTGRPVFERREPPG